MTSTIERDGSAQSNLLDTPATGARARPGVVLAVASIGVFMAFVDDTVVTIAFPNMVRSFHGAKLSELSWVLNAYNIALAALMIPAGRFADQLGRRRMYLTGLVLFTLASADAAAAQSLGWLVAARAVQGLGAAVIVPASLAIVLHAYPSERRAQAVAIWSAAAALAAGIGPSIGGALVDADDWRLVFLINLPIGVLATWLARRQLVQSRAGGKRLPNDLFGSVLLALAVGALTLAIVQGSDWGWASAGSIGAFAATMVGAVLLIRRSSRHPAPIVDLELLRSPGFAVVAGLTGIGAAGFFALGLANVLFMIQVWGYSPLQTGLATTPAPFIAALAAGAAGRLALRFDARRLVLAGAAVWSTGPVFLFLRADSHPDFLGAYLPAAALLGIGIGIAFPLVSDAAVALAPKGRYAGASALSGAIRQLGAAIGVAILAAILGSGQLVSVHLYETAWLFAAACFAIVAIGSLALAPFQASDFDEAEELARRRAELRVGARRRDAARPAAAPAAIVYAPGSEIELLAEVATFASLPADARRALAERAQTIRLVGGEWLFRQGDVADALYIVRSGRLEVLHDEGGPAAERLVELGRGSIVGELALLCTERRAASVRCRRDAMLLRIERSAFDELLADSAFAAAIARALGAQLRDSRPSNAAPTACATTIAIVRRAGEQRATVIEAELVRTLRRWQDVVTLTEARLREIVPDGDLGSALAQVLDRVEAERELVILSAAAGPSEQWLRACSRQADRVLLLADGDADVWIAERDALRGCDVALLEPAGTPALQALLDALEPRSTQPVRSADDVWRLARRIAGRSVGLVLSGGGARAFAHLGAIDELQAAGITIDRIGGASMGAFIGALLAQGLQIAEIETRCYREFVRRNPMGDYRIPRTSLVRGARARAMLERNLPGLIEDLPCSYFCVTTDIISARLIAHRRGELVETVGASMAIPGVFAPVPLGRHLLVDGAVFDNLPVTTMADENEGPIIACDVTRPEQRSLAPGQAAPRVGLIDMLTRVMLLGTSDTEALARRHAALLITPDHDGIGQLEFHQLDRARDAGRRAALSALEDAPAALFGC